MSDLRPLYFLPAFLAAPATLLLILAGGWFAIRVQPARSTTKSAAERALARLDAAARSGDPASFFELARTTLLQTFAARWQMTPDQITSAELKLRLPAAAEEVERLYALADEVKYSNAGAGSTDFQLWIKVVRDLLIGDTL